MAIWEPKPERSFQERSFLFVLIHAIQAFRPSYETGVARPGAFIGGKMSLRTSDAYAFLGRRTNRFGDSLTDSTRVSISAADTPSTQAMFISSTTSIRRSPVSYLATKDCGLRRAAATSAWVKPFALRASISTDWRSCCRGVRKDFCFRDGAPLMGERCSGNPDMGLSQFRIFAAASPARRPFHAH